MGRSAVHSSANYPILIIWGELRRCTPVCVDAPPTPARSDVCPLTDANARGAAVKNTALGAVGSEYLFIQTVGANAMSTKGSE
jgi:hypothetical protein